LVARAQQSAMPVVASLTNATFDGISDRLQAFRDGLREMGFVDGRNVVLEFHEARGDLDRLSMLTSELVKRRVNVIVTNGLATQTAQAATTTIPIVFTTGADPVELGFVASLSRPGRNLTGITGLGDMLGPKRLELLHKVVPAATDIGVLVNPPNSSNQFQLRDLRAAAQTLGLTLHVLDASTPQEFDNVFEGLAKLRAGGLVIATAPIFNNNSRRLAELAARHGIPAVYQYPEFVAAGGLMALGPDSIDVFRWIGIYCGRILKGEKPSELAVQQATKIQLLLNGKTAKALGISFPEQLLATADQVIE
jgi:putative ABC transport system substrate-binding protein